MTHESPNQAMRRRDFFRNSIAAGSLLLAPGLLAACSSTTSTTARRINGHQARREAARGLRGGGALETSTRSALNDADFGRGSNPMTESLTSCPT